MSVLSWLRQRGESTSPSSVLASSPTSVMFDCPSCRSVIAADYLPETDGWRLRAFVTIERLCDEHFRMVFAMGSSPATSPPSPSHPE
jgi:hypothetical protein